MDGTAVEVGVLSGGVDLAGVLDADVDFGAVDGVKVVVEKRGVGRVGRVQFPVPLKGMNSHTYGLSS